MNIFIFFISSPILIIRGIRITVIGVTNRANFNKTSETFTDQRLHVTLQGPSGTTGKLVVWSPYEPTAVHIVGREGQPPWDYKPSGGGYLIWVEVEFHSKATVIIDFTTTYYPYEPEPEEEIEIPWTTIAAGILIAGIFLTITTLIVVTSGTRRRVR